MSHYLTYAHKENLKVRFRQFACDPIPGWAVEVRSDENHEALSYADRTATAIAGLPEEFKKAVVEMAKTHSPTSDPEDVFETLADIALTMQSAFDSYHERVTTAVCRDKWHTTVVCRDKWRDAGSL